MEFLQILTYPVNNCTQKLDEDSNFCHSFWILILHLFTSILSHFLGERTETCQYEWTASSYIFKGL